MEYSSPAKIIIKKIFYIFILRIFSKIELKYIKKSFGILKDFFFKNPANFKVLS